MFAPPASTGSQEPTGPLATALLTEHHDIDAGIEAFTARAGGPAEGPVSEWSAPLTRAMSALRRHIYLEEEIVFPSLRTGALMMAIMVMIREHGELWRAMDALDAMLAEDQAGESPESRDGLVAACRDMLSMLDSHNMKEEPVIYPHIDGELDGAMQARLGEFLETGRFPDGWVCEGARGDTGD